MMQPSFSNSPSNSKTDDSYDERNSGQINKRTDSRD